MDGGGGGGGREGPTDFGTGDWSAEWKTREDRLELRWWEMGFEPWSSLGSATPSSTGIDDEPYISCGPSSGSDCESSATVGSPLSSPMTDLS